MSLYISARTSTILEVIKPDFPKYKVMDLFQQLVGISVPAHLPSNTCTFVCNIPAHVAIFRAH